MSEHKGNDWYLEPVYPWKENTPYNIHGTTSRIAGIRPFATYLTREEAGPLMAAPMLLKAAKAAVDAWHDDDRNFEREMEDGTPEWLAECRAALQAAEGESYE